MAKRKNKKARKPEEPKTLEATPYVPPLDRLDGQMVSRGVAKNGPAAQGFVYYYCVYVSGQLAHSPWMRIADGDLIEVYVPDNSTKVSWEVGNEKDSTIEHNITKPRVDSFFGPGGTTRTAIQQRHARVPPLEHRGHSKSGAEVASLRPEHSQPESM